MYLLNKGCVLNEIVIRGVFLTKKENNRKQTLIFLRSPKHFNIGKRKVISFNNRCNIYSNVDLKCPLLFFKNHPYIFNLIYKNFKFNILYRINSIKVIASVKVL